MSERVGFPIEQGAAHDVVRAFLDDPEPSRDVDPCVAATACLRSEDPEVRGDGAAVLAALADDDDQRAQAALYDLAAVLDADDVRTRVHAMTAFQVAALKLPGTAVELLDVVAPRLADGNPHVRTAAASAVAWIAEAVREDTRGSVPDGIRERFDPVVEPLLAVLDGTAAEGTGPLEWTAGSSGASEMFRGDIHVGASPHLESRWQAAFAVALLADWFPDRVTAYDATLAAVAETAYRPETRGYAIDALARAGADDVLRKIRDRARVDLDDPDRAAASLETLTQFIADAPALLVPAATDLAVALPDLDADSRELAAKAFLHAVVHHPDPARSSLPVRSMVSEWLRDGEDDDEPSVPVGADLVAELAVAHPECVLPVVGRAAEVPLATDALAGDGGAASGFSATEDAVETESWDAAQAWRVLRGVAERDREFLWDALESGWLRERLGRADDRGGEVRRLYAHAVPTPPPQAAVATLFESVLAGADGARTAVSTLEERAPDAVREAAVDVIADAPAPATDALAVLESLSDDAPRALVPRMETLWSWRDAIQPGDDGWTDLVTVLGRVAVATDDHRRIARMLHLERSTYCKRVLDTPVAAALVRAAPHKAVPALLDHLDHANPLLRKRVVRHFDALPTDHGGWGPTIRDAVLDATTDTNVGVRVAAVRTLGSWLDALTADGDDAGDDAAAWTSSVRGALLDRLSDDEWRIRARTVRALADDADPTTLAALEDHLAAESNQTVRFEIQRVLNRRDHPTSTDS